MYNASTSILETLDSCVKQTVLPAEIIVVDDHSSDDSIAIVKQWAYTYKGDIKISVKREAVNKGPSAARNVGWNLALGDYVMFLDADDVYVHTKVERVTELLLKHKDIVLLGHDYKVLLSSDDKLGVIEKLSVFSFLKRNLLTTSATIIKRDIMERFDETMRYTEDHDFWLRLTQKYDQTFYLKEKLVVRSRGMNTLGGQSANLWGMRKGEIKMYYKFCRRNRVMFAFPAFLFFSLVKHLFRMLT